MTMKYMEIESIYQEQILKSFFLILSSNYRSAFLLLKNIQSNNLKQSINNIYTIANRSLNSQKREFYKKSKILAESTDFWQQKAICILDGVLRRKVWCKKKSVFRQLRRKDEKQMMESAKMLKLYFEMMLINLNNYQKRRVKEYFMIFVQNSSNKGSIEKGLFLLLEFDAIRKIKFKKQFMKSLLQKNYHQSDTANENNEQITVELIKTIAICLKKDEAKHASRGIEIEMKKQGAENIGKILQRIEERIKSQILSSLLWNYVKDYDEQFIQKLETEIGILQRQFQSV